MKDARLFAVDLGASGGKLFAGRMENGCFSMREIHRFSHEGTAFHIPDRSGRPTERNYWNDVRIYENIVTGLRLYSREVSPHLDSVGIDTWGADGQLISRDGETIGKMYCYRDHRLDNMVGIVKSILDARRVYGITGVHFQPFNISNQLHWFVSNRSDLLSPGCFFLPVSSLFYYYLGGMKAVDSSWAGVTQLMDARKKTWSDEILDSLRIPRGMMPEIVEPGTVIGNIHEPIADSVGINPAALMAVASHDTASAFAAAPVSNPSEALIISSGTWSLVGRLVPEPITSDEAMNFNISNEGGIGNIRCLLNCMGTWLVQELRRVWAIADGKEISWDEITRMAESACPFEVFIDPDDTSFYNPADMEKAIAEYCARTGQRAPAGREGYVRSVYESLALKYRTVNEKICAVTRSETRSVNIVGGGSRNRLLNRFTADALALPVFAGPEEATAVGNFMAQCKGLGIINSMEETLPIIRRAFPIEKYTPENTQPWRDAYDRFRKITAAD